MCDTICVFVTDADISLYIIIILGALLAVFFIGFIIAVIYIIYIRRQLQGTLTRRMSTILQVLYRTRCSVFEVNLNTRFYLCLPAFSRPRYEGWPHHEQSFSIDVCLPHSLFVLSVTIQSAMLCCLSMSSWVYLEYGSLGLYSKILIPFCPGDICP